MVCGSLDTSILITPDYKLNLDSRGRLCHCESGGVRGSILLYPYLRDDNL